MVRRLDALGFVLLAASIYLLMPLSDAIVMGAITAYGLRVLVERLSTVIDRQIVEYALLGGLVLVTTTGMYLLVTNVSAVTVELIRLTQSMISSIQAFLEPYNIPMVSEYLSQSLSAISGFIRSVLFEIAASLPSVVLELLTFFLVVYYLYRRGDELAASLDDMIGRLPDEEAESLRKVRESITSLVRNVFVVYGSFGSIMATVGAVGYYVIGLFVMGEPVPFFWAWGILIGIAAFLEGVGSFVFTGPLMIYYFAVGEVWMTFWLLMFQATFLGILPAVMLPYIGSSRLQESFFTMMLGLIAGPMVFGLKGIVLGPVFIITLKDLVLARFDAV